MSRSWGNNLISQVTIERIGEFADKNVQLEAWVHNIRRSGKLLFPMLRDGTGFLQAVVVKGSVSEEVFTTCRSLTQESSVRLSGRVKADERAPGGHEIEIEHLELVQRVSADDPFPISPKEHGVEFLLDHRHLWLRSRRQYAVFRIRHEVIRATREFLDSNGFICVDTPILTPAACEGTTTLFKVPYFEDEVAYLGQSGQLYNEATAAAFNKTYCFGPTFRAEKSKTRRHLTEFWMVEPEMAYADLDDVMALAEEMIVAVVDQVLTNRTKELAILDRDVSKLQMVKKPFPRISYDEAVKTLQGKGSDIEWGEDFGATDETLIGEEFKGPVMVHRFPSAIKAFYMQPDSIRPELALGVDVIGPEGSGELVGGGQRIHEYDLLLEKLTAHGLPRDAFEWYLDLRKYGSVPHGGFGMGIERCVAWICGLQHVRETIAFPRMLHRMRP